MTLYVKHVLHVAQKEPANTRIKTQEGVKVQTFVVNLTDNPEIFS